MAMAQAIIQQSQSLERDPKGNQTLFKSQQKNLIDPPGSVESMLLEQIFNQSKAVQNTGAGSKVGASMSVSGNDYFKRGSVNIPVSVLIHSN